MRKSGKSGGKISRPGSPVKNPSARPGRRTDVRGEAGGAAAKRAAAIPFPAAWTWFADELLTSWVKQHHSPRDSWKDKPFTKDDAHFFFRGIEELSDLFTEERPGRMPQYFSHPKFRSAYLLYFLPLQASKFVTQFHLHSDAMKATLASGRARGTLRVADLGAGPGTASMALLLWILGLPEKEASGLPPIELHWLDTNYPILKEGRELALKLAEQFPRLRGKVTIQLHEKPWWLAPSILPGAMDLVLLGHVLNEAREPQSAQSGPNAAWPRILKLAEGGGLLVIEPAIRSASQHLSQLRDLLIESETIENSPASIWGPCLHSGRCPLADGRDWCHFSVPVDIPGRWFRDFSKGLGSERQWVKFSYLWFASRDHRAPMPESRARRVISDPIDRDRSGGTPSPTALETVLVCEPERPARVRVKASRRVRRGEIIKD